MSTEVPKAQRKPFSMIREFHMADWFTLGNAISGTGALFSSMTFLQSGDVDRIYVACGLVLAALVFDILDGRIARWRQKSSAMGRELDSLADVISFGIAPAVMSFAWGLSSLGRLGWAAGFMFVACAAMRLARFNVLSASGSDKRYYVGMPSPAAAAVPAATVFMFHQPLVDYRAALPALAVVLVPAVLMVSTIKYRSFKDLDLKSRRSFRVLVIIAAGIVAIATHPKAVLLVATYTYLASGFIGMAMTRFRRDRHPVEAPPQPPPVA